MPTPPACIRRSLGCRIAAAVVAIGSVSAACQAAETVVYRMGEHGYHTYRIPAIVKAANGDLLAFAEGRKNGAGDAGDIDLVLRRSSDGGVTWGEMAVLQDEWDDPTANVTYGNPAPVVDLLDPDHPGRVWLLLTRNNDGVLAIFSDDHGATWSQRIDITAQVKRPNWNWYATGPGHVLQLTRGPHAGRLVVASDHRTSDRPGWGAHAVISDDHGATWRIGAVDTRDRGDALHPNETLAEELTDGRVYFNARDQHGSDPATRAVAFSSDGGESFDEPFVPAPEFVTPVVQNSILRVAASDAGADEDLLVWCGPGDPQRRRDLTLMVSRDEARTWRAAGVIHQGDAAYSDIVLIDDAHVGVLYEAGPRADSSILFQSVPIDTLREQRD
ncbi:MAG: alpha-sialidase [Planctomycetaceae bacterium]|nr:alpha-sialidase [Planctomycetaceae bacterium]